MRVEGEVKREQVRVERIKRKEGRMVLLYRPFFIFFPTDNRTKEKTVTVSN